MRTKNLRTTNFTSSLVGQSNLMPLQYNLTLGDSIQSDEELIFHGWIEDAWDKYHEQIVAFAVASGPSGMGKVYTNGICALLEHTNLNSGDMIVSSTLLGTAAADGESVPYRKPYSVFKYDEPEEQPE